MIKQILRYGALALVSVCLVMIALVIGGLVPLETVRNTMAKVPAFVQVTADKTIDAAGLGDAAPVDSEASKTAEEEKDVALAPSQSDQPTSDETTTTSADEASAEAETALLDEVGEGMGSKRDDTKADNGSNSGEGETAQNQAAETDPSGPLFDVLRVEKDGSIVVAGSAAPNSAVELRTAAGTVVASGRTGNSGEFVIVPDKPLAAGDYSLSLVATDKDGREETSTETATIRVPKDQSGDVLAMVTKAGEASRIIAKPETLQDEDATETAANEQNETGSGSDDQAQTGAEQDESRIAGVEETDDPQENEVAKLDQQDTQPEGTEQTQTETESSENTIGEDNSDAVPAPTVRVEAVEIEQDQIFIAGEATQGSTVRIYIDGEPIGETRGTSDNRFLISKRFSLEPGEHKVRADSIDNKTGKVIARAEVPLLHDPVEDVAAADDTDEAGDGSDDAAQSETETEIALADTDDSESNDNGNESSAASETGSANTESEAGTTANSGAGQASSDQSTSGSQRDNEAVTANEDTASDESTGIDTGSDAAQASSNGDASENQAPSVADSSGSANEIDTTGAETPQTSGETASNVAGTDTGSENKSKQIQSDGESIGGRTSPEIAEAEGSPETGNGQSGTGGAVETAANEEPVDQTIRTGTSVIIKPGDSLWRISRNTYGRGIRYTTIYEANRDQIRNPNLIYIGQIFKIPDRPDEELVEADG